MPSPRAPAACARSSKMVCMGPHVPADARKRYGAPIPPTKGNPPVAGLERPREVGELTPHPVTGPGASWILPAAVPTPTEHWARCETTAAFGAAASRPAVSLPYAIPIRFTSLFTLNAWSPYGGSGRSNTLIGEIDPDEPPGGTNLSSETNPLTGPVPPEVPLPNAPLVRVIAQVRHDEVVDLLGRGRARRRPDLPRLSEEERESRKPLPPAVLAAARQDTVHRDVGRGRAAQTKEARRRDRE